jgi:murein L,D-transpeptidase YcbB/YkuD
MIRLVFVFLFLLFFNGFSFANTNEHLAYLVDQLVTEQQPEGIEENIDAGAVVARFYQTRGFQPLWNNPDRVERMLEELELASAEGLNPEDYHYSYLRDLQEVLKGKPSASQKAEFELLMTDALMVYGYHLLRGKVDPKNLEATWNYTEAEILEDKVFSQISSRANAGELINAFINLKPQDQLSTRLRKGLAFFRNMEKEYPFVAITDTPLIKPGESHSAVIPLRERLKRLTLLSAETPQSNNYDEALVESVKLFQALHNLDADGVIGKQTWRALNMSWLERIDILRINLERTRWVYHNRSINKFVLVNIAGYKLYVLEDGKLIWDTDIMVGTIKHETPVFRSDITYLEFNPTWTVPRSIVNRSLLPSFQANPASVKKRDFVLYDRSRGAVDPATLDWSKVSRSNFAYTVVQQPGEQNALGQVKFIFPNSDAIYLHDTPSKALFSKSSRAFSAGCVRVKDPFELARILLDNEKTWNAEAIQKVVNGRERKRVFLTEPVAVMLMYWTAEPYGENYIKFNPDIYTRDSGVLAGLDKPL